MNDAEDGSTVLLRLTGAEALVFFEWLARVDTARDLTFEDPAEEQVLWRLEGQLERQLIEPLGPDYRRAVEAPRDEVQRAKADTAPGKRKR